MEITRRDFNQSVLAGIAIASTSLNQIRKATAQPLPVRLPLHEFVQDERLLKALRLGVKEMKKRKPSDPLSWFFQAAIHGVTNRMIFEAAQEDPNVLNFGFESVWNQCPHFGQNSANFLPWHRAYTYHFEEILRMHTGESDFALPYWDYSRESQRTFPREFGIEHIDGDVSNDHEDNLNPLFHAERDYFLCGYEHPFTDQLPLTDLSPRATDASRALATPVFFGDNESSGLGGGVYDNNTSTRGLLEQAPHDQIHRAVGGSVTGTSFPPGSPGTTIGGMAIPMTAGFDPIFPVHHSNIDRLWMIWACSAGKSWGTLPSKTWFDETPWTFFGTDGRRVERPRKEYFDHRALGVRFKDEDMSCTPLILPEEITSEVTMASTSSPSAPAIQVSSRRSIDIPVEIVVGPDAYTAVDIIPESQSSIAAVTDLVNTLGVEVNGDNSIVLVIRDVSIGAVSSNGFDVYLVKKSENAENLNTNHEGYLGQISLFVHSMREGMKFDQSFDVTKAFRSAGVTLGELQVVFVPFLLTTTPTLEDLPRNFGSGDMKAGAIEIILQQ